MSGMSYSPGLRLAVPNREAWLDVTEDELYEHQTKLELRLVKCRDDVDRLQSRLTNGSYFYFSACSSCRRDPYAARRPTRARKKLIKELEVLSASS